MSHAPSSAAGHHDGDESHASYGGYLVGFVLSVILTVAAFAAVMMHAMSPVATIAVIAALAIVQIVVHVYYFLHMNGSKELYWNCMAFYFAVLIVVILVFGFLFVLHDTSMNMMSR